MLLNASRSSAQREKTGSESSRVVTTLSRISSTWRVDSSTASAALAPANADPSKQTGKGSVPPTGTLLQELLGQGGDPSVAERRRENLDALRERHERGVSPALQDAEPALDYLLGGEAQ